MRSPKDMRIIQIDITNACVHKCSNCTRFSGHHKIPYFMDWELFKRAVDSLGDFDGTIGIMGGEPTLHPQFERFVKYIGEKYPSRYNLPVTKKPIQNFIQYIRDRNFYLDETLNNRKGPGLFTSLCDNYYRHYELIQDVFSYQLINDHQNPCVHQPLLVSREELGIPDSEWFFLRDKCWIQNMWSASITPKGAFFCEVAGALDMLFDGPGGWPVEPGWWKREPGDFGSQLKWCEICGGAILKCGRLSSEEIDDVSPLMYERLKEIGSPKVTSGKVNILNMKNPQITGSDMPDTIDRYLTDYQKRISETNVVLNPKAINAVILCGEKIDRSQLKSKINGLAGFFDTVVPVAQDGGPGEWGGALCKAIKNSKDWICLLDFETELPSDLPDRLKRVVLNPGVLYRINTLGLRGEAILFNVMASALKNAGFDGVGRCASSASLVDLWNKDKQIMLDDDFDTVQNPDLDDWYRFADSVERQNKDDIYSCLEKIKDPKDFA